MTPVANRFRVWCLRFPKSQDPQQQLRAIAWSLDWSKPDLAKIETWASVGDFAIKSDQAVEKIAADVKAACRLYWMPVPDNLEREILAALSTADEE